MKELIDIEDKIIRLKMQSLELNQITNSLKHNDPGLNLHINNLKRISNQALDVFHSMERQLAFIKNSYKSFKFNEQLREQKETQLKEAQIRRSKNDYS